MDIRIEYCVVWNFEPKALSLRDDLNEDFGYWAEIKSGARGSFEVVVSGQLIFSKLELDRFPNEGEIIKLIRENNDGIS